MPTRAMRLLAVVIANQSSPAVLRLRHWLQVIWVYAAWVSADVIQNGALRNRTMCALVINAMRIAQFAAYLAQPVIERVPWTAP